MIRKKILSVLIHNLEYKQCLDWIISASKKRMSSYVCVANVHMCVEAHNDPLFCRQLNDADLVSPDGMPLVFALRLLYGLRQERIAGMDLLPDLLRLAEKNDLKVFFYGGTDEMIERTKTYIVDNYPLLSNTNYFSPPFRKLTEKV